jgi:putative peptidoglycan lipid II flippase
LAASTPVARRGRAAPPSGHVARNTAIFSIATGFSRIAGLVREIIAARFFGTGSWYSAFTIAFQVPNLVSNLFANAALSAAFVPVFTELLQEGRKKEAFRLASTVFWIMLIALGAITAFFILAAHAIMPLFIASGSTVSGSLTAGLAQVLFPVVLLLGLNGLLVGILQSYDRFSIAALSPLVWNVVIIVGVIVLRPHFPPTGSGNHGIYAYAIAILAATVVQMLLAAAALQQIDFRLGFHVDWHDPRVRQVFVLMLPVTIGLGIVNLDQLINSVFGTLVRTTPRGQGPSAINYAFRVYMLPQGMFSVAVATVLFPTLSRQASRRDAGAMRRALAIGMRQINLLLIPASAFLMVLTTPIVRLIYQHGHVFNAESTHLTSIALFWYAVSLPFGGINLLLTRTFFALKRPWIPTRLAAMNIAVDIIVSVGLYKPLGIAGLVIGTAVANMLMTGLLLQRLRTGFNGRLEARQTTMITVRIAIASAVLAAVSWGVWRLLDSLLGGGVPAQIIAVGGGAIAGGLVYMRAVLLMRIPEARQVRRLVLSRFRRP